MMRVTPPPHELCRYEIDHALAPARSLDAEDLAASVDDVVDGLPLAFSEVRLRVGHGQTEVLQCLGS